MKYDGQQSPNIWRSVFTLFFCIFVSSIPLKPLLSVGFINATKLSALGVVSSGIMYGLVSRYSTHYKTVKVILGLFVLWSAFITAFVSPSLRASFDLIRQASQVTCVLLLLSVRLSRNDVTKILNSLLYASLLSSIFLISNAQTYNVYYLIIGIADPNTIPPLDPNQLGLIYAIALSLAPVSYIYSNTTPHKFLILLSVPVVGFAVLITGSRAAIMAISLVALSFALYWLVYGQVHRFTKISLSIIFCVVAYVSLSPTNISKEAIDISKRLAIWKSGLDLYYTKPLTGVGIGNYVNEVRPIFTGNAYTAHNTYLSVLVERGLVGLSLLISFVTASLYKILGVYSNKLWFILPILVVLAGGASLTLEMRPLFWLCPSLVLLLSGHLNTKRYR